MLPEVTFRHLSVDDIDRIAWWLEDTEVSSNWFGHYGCGDPIHRGYDPRLMLEATEWEWERVFGDPGRLIYSIYDEGGQHIGECQVVLDGEGGAELSLLIGRKDLWHRGYGTSTVVKLLDKLFGPLGLDTAWVNVPEENGPALGLFEKLGFALEATRDLCTRPDGTALKASILSIGARSHRASTPKVETRSKPIRTVVAIAGLAGSGSEALGEKVARMTGSRFLNEELSERLAQRLRCSVGEIEALEASSRSRWARLLSPIALPLDWSTPYDSGFYHFWPDSDEPYRHLDDAITRKSYLEGMTGVVKGLATKGNVVLHGSCSHLFVPSSEALTVFVSASPSSRARRVAAEHELSIDEASRLLKRQDRGTVYGFKSLFGSDLLDPDQYDLSLNLDRLPLDRAAQIIVGALGATADLAVAEVATRA
jgi:cytidylate kinase/RimJ/RimL family protein N-acetyltransferase